MTPEKPRHDVEGQADFSVVSWKSKGDDLWLHHKAGGNKKANLYELALVGEIEALRAERIASAALGTPEGELAEIQRRHDALELALADCVTPTHMPIHKDRAFLLQHTASQARTIAALSKALEPFATEIHEGGTMPDDAELTWHLPNGTCIRCDIDVDDFHNARRALKENPNG